jgi:hypothetical protein
MKLRYQCVVCFALIAGGLLSGACTDRPGDASRAGAPTSSPHDKTPAGLHAGKLPETASPGVVDKPVQAEPPVAVEQPEQTPPLDLSMPVQPKVELGSLEGKRMPAQRLLPDLFERDGTPDERTLSLKGRVLTNKTGREDLDAIQGGEITMELKTR